MASRTHQEKRRSPRYLVYWPVAIYPIDPVDGDAILRGTTCEVSKDGAAILSDRNILLESKVSAIMQITIPPLHRDQQATTIEFPCYLVHSYLSSNPSQFRIGVDFMELSMDSRILLDKALSVARSFISSATY